MIEMHYLPLVHTRKLREPLFIRLRYKLSRKSPQKTFITNHLWTKKNLNSLHNQIHCKSNSNNPYATYGINYVKPPTCILYITVRTIFITSLRKMCTTQPSVSTLPGPVQRVRHSPRWMLHDADCWSWREGHFVPTNSEAGVTLICRKFISDHDLWQHEGTTGHCVFSKF